MYVIGKFNNQWIEKTKRYEVIECYDTSKGGICNFKGCNMLKVKGIDINCHKSWFEDKLIYPEYKKGDKIIHPNYDDIWTISGLGEYHIEVLGNKVFLKEDIKKYDNEILNNKTTNKMSKLIEKINNLEVTPEMEDELVKKAKELKDKIKKLEEQIDKKSNQRIDLLDLFENIEDFVEEPTLEKYETITDVLKSKKL